MFEEIQKGPQSYLLSKESILASISEIDSLSIEESDSNGILVWDDEDAKTIPFHFLEKMSPQSLSDRIYISPDIPAKYQINQALLADYLWNTCDRNAFITLDEVVVIWSEPNDPESFEPSDFTDAGSKHLYEKFGDEYAYEISLDFLGQLWFERNVVVINMGEIVRTAESIERHNSDICDPYFSLENQVLVGFLTTAIHELRHLQMDTNILLPEDEYPLSLCAEAAVEDYCREAFEKNRVSVDIFPKLYLCGKSSLSDQIDSAASRATGCHSAPSSKAMEPEASR